MSSTYYDIARTALGLHFLHTRLHLHYNYLRETIKYVSIRKVTGQCVAFDRC